MQLTKDQVNQFHALFGRYTGESLSSEQAERYGTEIVTMIQLALVSQSN